jgi:hypothetical protein
LRLPCVGRAPARGGRAHTDEDLSGAARLREPDGEIHGLAGDDRASETRTPDENLAALDADSQSNLVTEAPPEPERAVERSVDVVL